MANYSVPPVFTTSTNIQRYDQAEHLVLPGRLVPRATKEMEVTASFMPIVQPKLLARSPIRAVNKPITRIEVVKHNQPLQ